MNTLSGAFTCEERKRNVEANFGIANYTKLLLLRLNQIK